MEINTEEPVEYIKQEQNDIIKEKWIPFLSEYCDCQFVLLKEGVDPTKYDNTKNVYEEIFNNMKPIKSNEVNGRYNIRFKFNGDKWQIVKNNSWGHLNYVCTEIRKRHQQENGYW